jgi:alpha-N-arabinofuranosidase
MRGLNGSASLHNRSVVLTVTNPDPKAALETEIAILGANIKEAGVTALAAQNIHAHNSFENPRAIEPKASQGAIKGRTLIYEFAPASVTRLQITLA